MRIRCLLILLLYHTFTFAQIKRTAHWYFGFQSGVDFSGNIPVADTSSKMSTIEGSTTMSDTMGNLLFYSNGEKVWGNNHSLLVNGDSLAGDHSSVQSSLALPVPGSATKYCLFTTGYGRGAAYSIIDMNIGSQGGVIASQKNIALHYPAAECLAATLHCDAFNYWIITQHPEDNQLIFNSYLLSSNGISLKATSVFNKSVRKIDRVATMNFSLNGDMLVYGSFTTNIYLLDFNKKNGKLSMRDSVITSPEWVYSTALSPDDSKLYVSSWKIYGYCHIYQYDLNATNITNSRVALDSVSFIGGSPNGYGFTGRLQLAPDQKIYLSRWKQTPPKPNPLTTYSLDSLDVINAPNLQGASCNFQRNGLYLNHCPTMLGLPTFVSNFLSPVRPLRNCNYIAFANIFADTICSPDSLIIDYTVSDSFNTGNVFTVQLSGPWGNFQTYKNIGTATTNKPGSILCYIDSSIPPSDYLLRIVSTDPQDTTTVDYKLSVERPRIMASFKNYPCENDTLFLNCSNVFATKLTYAWSGPNSFQSSLQNPFIFPLTLDNSGKYYVTATDAIGCEATDVTTVAVDSIPPGPSVTTNSPVCERKEIILFANSPLSGVQYNWSGPTNFSDSLQNVTIKNAALWHNGIYCATATTNHGCVSKPTCDTIIVNPIPSVPYINDTSVCQHIREPRINLTGSNIKWYLSDNDTGSIVQPTIKTDTTGIQTIYITQAINGCESDKTPLTINIEGPPVFNLGGDITICRQQQLAIGAKLQDTVTYKWNTGSEACCIIPGSAGNYIQSITNKCGTTSDSLLVAITACDSCLFIPSAFTPNNDGKNDMFGAIPRCPLRSYSLNVYNRWGERVFHSNDPVLKWDGQFKGQVCEVGTFYYSIQYTPALFEAPEFLLKGDLVLIR